MQAGRIRRSDGEHALRRAAAQDRRSRAARPYKAEKYVAAAAVTELPGVTSKPDNLRHFYPHEAEQRGFEGDVVLRLLIDADGSLAKVDLVSDPGEGLDAAGVRAIRTFRFRPGKLKGSRSPRPSCTPCSSGLRISRSGRDASVAAT
jgi:periplasmic protein TonB